MSNSLKIDGINYPKSDILGIDTFSLVIEEDEDSKVLETTLSEELILKGQAYTDLKSEFFETCDDNQKLIPAKFSSQFCDGFDIDLFITGETVAYAPCECEIRTGAQSVTELECASKKLNAYEWFANGFAEQYDFPLVWFCNQPSFLQFIALLFRQILGITYAPANLILNVADSIVGTIVGLFGGNSDDLDLNPIDNVFALIDEWITGCGRIVPAPLLRDVFEYQANQCGLEFKAPIWQHPNSPYYNETIACFEAGSYLRPEDCEDKVAILETFYDNAPNISTLDLLQQYEKKYCYKCKILNIEGKPTLCFEHETYYQQIEGNPLFSLSDICTKGQIESTPVYSYNLDKNYTTLSLEYCKDSQDKEGNKTRKFRESSTQQLLINDLGVPTQGEFIGFYRGRYSLFETDQLNNGPCDIPIALDGNLVKEIPFGAARFQFDCLVSRNRIDRYLDAFRTGGSFISDFLLLSNQGVRRDCDLIMYGDSAQYCKSLILEDNFNLKDARVKKVKTSEELKLEFNGQTYTGSRECYAYQWDNWTDFLFDRFHKHLRSEYRRDKLEIEGNLEILCTCNRAKEIIQNPNSLWFEVHDGHYAKAAKWEIDFSEVDPKIIISEIKVFCEPTNKIDSPFIYQ